MERSIKKYLFSSQLCLWLSVIVCLALIPHFLFSKDEGGMSNYGVHLKTVIPYSIGLLLAALFVVKAALRLKRSSHLRAVLLGYAAALSLILITTYGYKRNIYLKDTHIAVTIVFFWFELLTAVWLCKRFLADQINISLIVLQLIGFIIGAVTLFGPLHLLFVAQLLTIIPFGMILIRSSGVELKN